MLAISTMFISYSWSPVGGYRDESPLSCQCHQMTFLYCKINLHTNLIIHDFLVQGGEKEFVQFE